MALEDRPAVPNELSSAIDHPGGPRRSEPPFPAVARQVRDHLREDTTGHDMHHVWRVFRLGQQFATELDADREVVGCAALVHDLHRVVGDGTGCHPTETLPQVAEILEHAGVDEACIQAVQHCVAVHDELACYGEDPDPNTIEAEIVRDADNLDAMGAIGVARTFTFGGAHGSPLWDPEGELDSQLQHFEDKLLRLRGELHTEPARALGADRHAFLEEFLERFVAEWHADA